jgi:probable HAF family extracellular repeat protein
MRRAFVLATVAWTFDAHAESTFQGLDVLGGEDPYSYASGVSANGAVAVGASDSPAGTHAFRWTSDGGMVDLGVLQGYSTSYARAVSADGATIVGNLCCSGFYPSLHQAFRWTSSGMIGLGFLAGDQSSFARDVSADGSVIVGYGSQEAFRWTTAGGMVGLGFLPGDTFSEATAVSDDGSVIVGYSIGSGPAEAFRWTSSDGMVGLGVLPGARGSVARDVSADGSVIVGYSSDETAMTAFRWTHDEGMVALAPLSGWNSMYADGISADGSVVVGAGSAQFETSPFYLLGTSAFVWDASHAMRELSAVLLDDGVDLAGWFLSSATDVSADGSTIVGEGTDGTFVNEAWLATIAAPVPEPGSSLPGITAVLVLAAIRRPHGRDRGIAGRFTCSSLSSSATGTVGLDSEAEQRERSSTP